jgi:HlyD family secretion protein
MTKKKKRIVWLVIIVVVAVAVAWPFLSGKKEAQISYEMTVVQPDTIQNSVTATGTIEPVTKVEVGTQVSGIVSKIYVDYNSVVHKGEVIAELDKTNLESELSSAKANLASAKSKLDYEKANYARYKTLYAKGLVSTNDYQSALLTFRQASEAYSTQMEGVRKAQTNLGYATITSPINGVVLSKAVEEGQTVAASFSTPTLFTIAQDLTNMRVIADVDEADIGSVKQGQSVTFTVDAYPDDVFDGKVTQVRQEATTESNVVTYEVAISAPNKDLKLKPGLTATVTIHTLNRTGVVSVKNKALRFTPTQALLGKMTKIVDCNGKNKLWTREGNKVVAHSVEIGVTDGLRTEIKSGIASGTQVILNVSQVQSSDTTKQATEENPFMPHPGKKNKK